MKYFYLLVFSISFISKFNSAAAQEHEINCDSLCVTDIKLIGLKQDSMEVTIYNGDTDHINYPLVKVIYRGDTVFDQDNFEFFAHMGKRSQIYRQPTELQSIPFNFSCKVVMIDPLWKDTCILDYPCQKPGSTSINETRFSGGFSIYPNPANHYLNIEVNSEKPTDYNTQIFSINGSLILEKKITVNNKTVHLNVNELPPGLYIIKLQNENRLQVQKFVKE